MKELHSKRLIVTLGVVAVLITVTGIMFKQEFLNILPLYISLAVAYLQSQVNRKAYLLGGINSLLYAAVYFHFKLYASAASAAFFSTSMQFLTYFLWGRKPRGNATEFRSMSGKQRLLAILGFAVLWAALYGILSTSGSAYRVFDVSGTLLGIVVSTLTMFAFIEYMPLMILNLFITIGLHISMTVEKPAQITYVIYSVFSLICQFCAQKKILVLYAEQRKKG